MKKVLVITYYWPPAGGAGVQRWLKFVKYLRETGYEPVVYTAQNGEMPVVDQSLEKDIPAGLTVIKKPIWEPYSFYKVFIGRKKDDRINASFLSENKKPGLLEKISVWVRGNFFIPDARRFWIRPSIAFLTDYIQKEKIELLISTGPPHSMHMIALGLKKRLPQLSWLADFRDPWTRIDFYDKLMLSPAADRKHRRLEKEVLLNADRVISIGRVMTEELREIYRDAGGKQLDKFSVISNGFDEADVTKGEVIRDSKFSLAHIGTLVRDRNPIVLWKALKDLVAEHPEFAAALEIKLVGKLDLMVKESIDSFGLGAFVRKIDYMPHDEVIVEQQRSKVLLLLVNRTHNAKGILTGKFYEYMAAGPPVLAIGPVDGELAETMKVTGCGLISDFDDVSSLRANILVLFRGELPKRDEKAIAGFSRRAQAFQLAALLTEMQRSGAKPQ